MAIRFWAIGLVIILGYGTARAQSFTKERITLRGHKDDILSIALSNDGTYAASVSTGLDGDPKALGSPEIFTWDLNAGKAVSSGYISTGMVAKQSIVFSKDGTRILYGTGSGAFVLTEAPNLKKVIINSDPQPGRVFAIAISPDGKHVVTGTGGKITQPSKQSLPDVISLPAELKLWIADSGTEVGPFNGHTDQINAAGFSPDGKKLISGSADGSVRIWDIESRRQTIAFRKHGGAVISACFGSEGKVVVSLSARDFLDVTSTYQVKVWNHTTGAELLSVDSRNMILDAALVNGDRYCLVATAKQIDVWDIDSRKVIGQIASAKGAAKNVVPAQKRPPLKRPQAVARDGSEIECMTCTANGKFLAVGRQDKSIVVYETQFPKD